MFVDACAIIAVLSDEPLPPAVEATRLALSAAHRYRSGRDGLNIGDCLHYACAKYFDVPILATANEFTQTDVKTAP